MHIPMLLPVNRRREYDSYSDELRDRVIYSMLFLDDISTRSLDQTILNLDPKISKGYQSMGILHFIGIKKEHKSIFVGMKIDEAIDIMIKQNSEHFKKVIESLQRYQSSISILDEIEQDEDDFRSESEIAESRKEGKARYHYSKKYERDERNRADAIAYHGTRCKICEFDFEEVYGERGVGYIEIHHIVPLCDIGEEQEINPKTDLVPVCSNCHRMIHRRKDNILSIEDMRVLLKENRQKN